MTVRPPVDEERLADWAAAHALRYSRIVLDRGATPDQPMLTFTGSGTLDGMRRTVRTLTDAMCSAGFSVVRVKIEASPRNAQIPQSTQEAESLSAAYYFEHHIKLLLSSHDDLGLIRTLAEPHSAHVSRNARRSVGDRGHERFVTQRCRGVGLVEAGRQLEGLRKDLNTNGFTIIEVEQEFVVHDDQPALDAGWITDSDAAVP